MPSYQWEEFQPGGTEWTPIADSWPNAGVATDKLRIYSFNPERNGTQIRCVVSNAAGSVIQEVTIGPTVAADFTSGPWGYDPYAFKHKSATGVVPAGTRTIKVTLTCQRSAGIWCDGKADGISLVLTY